MDELEKLEAIYEIVHERKNKLQAEISGLNDLHENYVLDQSSKQSLQADKWKMERELMTINKIIGILEA